MTSKTKLKVNRDKVYYHGSPRCYLTYLAVNTYITSYMYLAIAFGRYDISTGRLKLFNIERL